MTAIEEAQEEQLAHLVAKQKLEYALAAHRTELEQAKLAGADLVAQATIRQRITGIHGLLDDNAEDVATAAAAVIALEKTSARTARDDRAQWLRVNIVVELENATTEVRAHLEHARKSIQNRRTRRDKLDKFGQELANLAQARLAEDGDLVGVDIRLHASRAQTAEPVLGISGNYTHFPPEVNQADIERLEQQLAALEDTARGARRMLSDQS